MKNVYEQVSEFYDPEKESIWESLLFKYPIRELSVMIREEDLREQVRFIDQIAFLICEYIIELGETYEKNKV